MARDRVPTPPVAYPGYSVRSTSVRNDVDGVGFLESADSHELIIGELREGERAVGIWSVTHSANPLGAARFNADACERLADELSARAMAMRTAERVATAEQDGS